MSKGAIEQTVLGIEFRGGALLCSGSWTLANIRSLRKNIHSLCANYKEVNEIDASNIVKMDSAGAVVFEQLIIELLTCCPELQVVGLNARSDAMIKLIAEKNVQIYQSIPTVKKRNLFDQIGLFSQKIFFQILAAFTFLGECFFVLCMVIRRPNMLSLNSILTLLYCDGAQALPIIALMSFLIGVVLAYQMGIQLKTYNANIYVVQFTGIAILREFSPLITAIIMAGRTSTSFASLLGSMKVNEEISALETMGKNIIATLVFPRAIALLISLPLLVVWSSIFSILGSMVMAKIILNISYSVFLQNFTYMVGLKPYVLGILKVPFFAIVVAFVGCYQGLTAGMSTQSVGQQTTKAAVQAIFIIIVTDSVFSIIYSVLGI